MRSLLFAAGLVAVVGAGAIAFEPPPEVANLEGLPDVAEEACYEEDEDCYIHLEEALLQKIARGGMITSVGNTTIAVKAPPPLGYLSPNVEAALLRQGVINKDSP